MKLNIGCGRRKLAGWVNLDANPAVQPDILAAVPPIPLEDNTVGHLLMESSLEHIPHCKLWSFFDEVERVCKDGAVVEIVVPHYSSVHAHDPLHHTYWHSTSLNAMCINRNSETGERHSHLRLWLDKVELRVLMRTGIGIGSELGRRIGRLVDWPFNRGPVWQQACERLWPFGFDEVWFRARVVKGQR